MTGFSELTELCSSSASVNSASGIQQEGAADFIKVEPEQQQQQQPETSKSSLWSNIIATTISVFDFIPERSKKAKSGSSSSYLSAAVRRAVYSEPMRKLQDRLLGTRWTSDSKPSSEIWLLGVCYKWAEQSSSGDVTTNQGNADFLEDFSSRIWLTYRKGFKQIDDTKYDSDSGWGCMLRSGQMLIAQALLCHYLGRAWRRREEQPYDEEYIEILRYFGDEPSEACPVSIHNLLEAGKPYGLVAGEWLRPYALCRSLEALARAERERCLSRNSKLTLPMAIYVVSGDGCGDTGGAPVLCIADAIRLCSEWAGALQHAEVPLLILIPLVLGVDKINPRYLPSLSATFTFPQSLGFVGGKPRTSTYIIGVQDDQAIYLDPHEIQQAVVVSPENIDAAAGSYHCSVVRNMLLSDIDPSLAIGFYCRNRDDFDDLCSRATELAQQSNGAPLFTVAQSSETSTVGPSLDIMLLDNDTASLRSVEDDWEMI